MINNNYKVQAIITNNCKIRQCQYWDIDGGYCFIPRENICPKVQQITTLYEPQESQKAVSDLGDILRKWLVSSISDEELCKAFHISEYDRKILFQEKMATWNSYIGSLVDECDYPLCKVRQAINEKKE